MDTTELMAAMTPLILAVIGLLLQYVRAKDTDKHGDAFLTMLKGNAEMLERVAVVLPSLAPYVREYNSIVLEAERIWNSSGLTAQDIQMLEMKASLYKSQIEAALVKYRELKEVLKEG